MITRYLIGAALIATFAAGIYFKIRHDAQADLLVTIEREKDDAISKAREARDRLRVVCDAAPDSCMPDDWYRD